VKHPSTKHQVPEKLQIPNWKIIDDWSFSGAWCLVLGCSFANGNLDF
jgi:hypothetical protein